MLTDPGEILTNYKPRKFEKEKIYLYSLQDVHLYFETPVLSKITLKKIDAKHQFSYIKKYRRNLTIQKFETPLLLLNKILIPNILSALITVIVIYCDNKSINFYGKCVNNEIFNLIIHTIKYGFIINMYYFKFAYFVLFPAIFNVLPNNDVKIIKTLAFSLGILFSISIQILKYFKMWIIYNIDIDIYLINTFILLILYHMLLCRYKLPLKKYRIYSFILMVLLIILSLDYYVMKNYVIFYFHQFITQFYFGKFYFQLFLFIYFQFYGTIIRFLTIKFFKAIDISDDLTDTILIFLKNYLSSALSSSLIIPLIEQETYLSNFFGIINFAFQLLVFYDQNFLISLFRKSLIFVGILKKTNTSKNVDVFEVKLKSLMSASTTDITMLYFCRMAIMMIYRRFLGKVDAYEEFKLNQDCNSSINGKIEFYPQNLIVLFIVNYLIFFYFLSQIKENSLNKNFKWSFESYNLLQKSYYFVMMHFIADGHLQFYFSLFLKSQNIVNLK